ALVGANGLRVLACLQSEHLVFQFLRERPPLEVFQVAARLRRRSIGVDLRQVSKVSSLLQLFINRVGLLLGRSYHLGIGCFGSAVLPFSVFISPFWVEIRISLNRTCSARVRSALCWS